MECVAVAGRRQDLHRKPIKGPRFKVNPEDHDALVISIALQYGAQPWAVRDSEQYANGWIGLIRAAELYDPDFIAPSTGQRVQFSTYATWWIRQAILRPGSRKKKPPPALQFSQFSPPDNECGHLSPAEEIMSGGGDDPLSNAITNETNANAVDLLRVLDPRTRRMVVENVMKGRTLENIAAEEDPPITRERVRQLVLKGIKKIRLVVYFRCGRTPPPLPPKAAPPPRQRRAQSPRKSRSSQPQSRTKSRRGQQK
jgi:RNA polymerase sigma factor (sigma-70 family)